MTISIQRRLSVALTSLVIVVGAGSGLVSYLAALDDAHEQQDEQLRIVARLVAASSLGTRPDLTAGDDEDEQIRIGYPGLGFVEGEGHARVEFPTALPAGCSTVRMGRHDWRIYAEMPATGPAVFVAQRTAVRDHLAQIGAQRSLTPVLVLFPALLLMIHVVLRGAFRPLNRLVDALAQSPESVPVPDAAGLPREIAPFVGRMNASISVLQRMVAERKRFIADAAHELRSPMTALVVQVQNLEQVPVPDEARNRLQSLKAGLLRACQLLEQLLSLARLQEEGSRLTEQVAMDQVMREVLEALMPLAVSRAVGVEVVRLEPVVVLGNRLTAYKLAKNLVDNAMRFSPPQGDVQIELSVPESGLREMLLRVSDSGPGIAPDEIDLVFQPFFRSRLRPVESGTGLGLAIVAEAAANLGGRVRLFNRVPHGLVAEYRQPLAPVDPPSQSSPQPSPLP